MEELAELVEAFDGSTQRLVENSQDATAVADAERQLHTIKGGARMTGLLAIGDLSHAGESLLNLVGSNKVSADETLLEKLQHVSDELFRMYELAAKGKPIEPVAELIIELEQLSGMSEVADTSVDNGTDSDEKADAVAEDETESEVELKEEDTADIGVIEAEDELSEADTHEPADQVTEAAAIKIDPMMEIYLEELSELTEAFDKSTQKLVEDPSDSETIKEAERQLHTIKGGARMTGLLAIGDLSHAGETLLNLVANDKKSADDSLLDKLQQVSDTLYKMYESAAAGKVVEVANRLIDELNALSGQEPESEATTSAEVSKQPEVVDNSTSRNPVKAAKANLQQPKQPQSKPDKPGINKKPHQVVDFGKADENVSGLEKALKLHADELNSRNLQLLEASPKAETIADDQKASSSIRVPTELINRQITASNEWGYQNIRLVEQYEESGKTIAELRRTADRLKEQIRNLELEADSTIHAGGPISSLPKLKGSFDPLEMDEYTELQQQSRSLAESLEDLMSLSDSLEMDLKRAEEISGGQERIFKSIQDGLISTRMTKVTGLVSRLKRIVRQVSSELGKKVSVEVGDENGEMDRTILERITASLEHLIRNSLVHGVEKPEVRIQSGKSPEGKIRLNIERDGPEVVITLEDDGAGINVEKLRALSIKKGLISEDAVLSHHEIYQLILMSGVSTADKVNQIAGRGVGMDVVNEEVNALGGNIIIDSELGKFTRFELRVPYNLATNQVMFMDVSGEVLAVPVAKLEGMQRISQADLNAAYARKYPAIECSGQYYKLHHLGQTLGLVKQRPSLDGDKTLPVILFQESGQRVAYQVDEIRGNREVMLKPLGALFEQSKLLSTVAIQGGGQIVLVLNAHELISLGVNDKTIQSSKAQVIKKREKTRVMVVDDSITVRKITQNLLSSAGYSVVTANDGINALEQLVDESPDLMLLDIEMPRMDGFELLENMRGSMEWMDLPVIMISSRSGAKHRLRAQELGANGFIGKPWEVEQLVKDIETCLVESNSGVLV